MRWLILSLTVLLAACGGDGPPTRAIGAGLESWCRNSPQHCDVSTERR